MIFTNYIRGIVQRHPELKNKLKKAASKQTPFQYVFQSIVLTMGSLFSLYLISFLVFKDDLFTLAIVLLGDTLFGLVIYQFWFSSLDVQIRKEARELDADILFVSEYFLVSLESGLPLGNSIQNLSRLERPGGKFFKKVFTEFNTGKDLEQALEEGANNCPSSDMKVLLRRLKDSLEIGVDLKQILINFIEESSEKKIVEIRSYSKKLNPLVMMYLLLGIVIPSLGITFFILGASFLSITPDFLRIILILVFLVMFAFQYIAYTGFKFSRATL
jgi:Flp pilus assembly protein TadB